MFLKPRPRATESRLQAPRFRRAENAIPIGAIDPTNAALWVRWARLG